MAAPKEPATAPRRHIHIEAVQTVTPMKATEPGITRRIASAATLTSAALASHLRLVLYYKRAREDDSGWAVAGWLKESLNAALSEQPLLAGRLRLSDDEEGLELRLNDAGVRLVQAKAEVTMEEFLAAEDREAKEAYLASWVDVDQEKPQFSALFYVQVTSFQDDAYSIGISCSLLLADPLFVFRFLNKWTQIHAMMQAEDHFAKTSIFHLGNFKREGRASHLKSIPIDSIPSYINWTVLFDNRVGGADEHNVIAAICLEEAVRRVEEKVEENSEFSLITTSIDRLIEFKIDESCRNERSKPIGSTMGSPSVIDWDRLHGDELAISEGNKPVQVSYNIIAGGGRPLIVVMPPLADGEQGLISVTFPKKVQ